MIVREQEQDVRLIDRRQADDGGKQQDEASHGVRGFNHPTPSWQPLPAAQNRPVSARRN
jgi:hypothetical protein